MEKLVLVDGNSLINRAYYALPGLTNSSGEFCGAIYGFCNLITKIIRIEKPKYMAICFDAAKKTFRNEIYADYKGTRKPMPNELAEQLPKLKEILKAMNIFIIEQKGIEADDLIGSLAKKFQNPTVIFSGDRDLLQLIDASTEVHLTKKGVTDVDVMTIENLKEKMGIEPYQVVELKALMGDSSDNIPGVMGIGEVGAKKLLDQYNDIDNLYQHIDEITGKLGEKLVNGKASAYMSRTLATINTSFPIDVEIDDLTYDFPFSQQVFELFNRYEFKSLINNAEYFTQEVKTEKLKETVLEIIDSDDKLNKLIEKINNQKLFSIYFGQNQIDIAFDEKTNYQIKCEEELSFFSFNMSNVVAKLKPILEDNSFQKICLDTKKTKHILHDYGVHFFGTIFDVSLANYLSSGSKKTSDNPEFYTSKFNFESNAIACSLLFAKKEYEKSLEEQSLCNLYYDLEFPLIDVLYDMEICGFKLDRALLKGFTDDYKNQMDNLSKDIQQLAGLEFNLNSPKQLAEVLFEKLLIPKPKKSGTGAEVLEKLIGVHPIIEKILEYRRITKLYTTYLVVFDTMLDKNNMIHTEFNQTLTATGRLSSKEPNLQNIPVKTDEGKLLRKMFVSSFENGYIVSADYSQIELRLLAHFSKEPKLVEAYKNGRDIHSQTACDIFNLSIDKIDYEKRRKAKAVNFGVIYGISGYGLSQNLNIPVKEAKNFIDKYFETYPFVKKYMDKNIEFAKENGYAISLLGRKRKIDEIYSSNNMTRQFGERISMNMPLQGSASDIIKLAMIKVYNRLKQENLKSKLILQIHDELLIDTASDEKEKVETLLKECMENVVKLDIPLTVSISSGKTWFDAK